VTSFAADVLATLRQHPWPGNVRQLRNEIERQVILADGPVIEELSVSPPPDPAATAPEPAQVATLEEAERIHIEAALRAYRGNIMATATAIGVSRGLLYRKMVKYRLKA